MLCRDGKHANLKLTDIQIGRILHTVTLIRVDVCNTPSYRTNNTMFSTRIGENKKKTEKKSGWLIALYYIHLLVGATVSFRAFKTMNWLP